MSTRYEPQPEHKFTFGLWTVGNIGRDPFGEPVRRALSPAEIVHLLTGSLETITLHHEPENNTGLHAGKRYTAVHRHQRADNESPCPLQRYCC